MTVARLQKHWAFCREKLSQIDLNNPVHQRHFAIVLGAVMGCLLFGSVSWAVYVQTTKKDERISYNPTRFDQYDAEQICGKEMTERLGTSLLRYHVDEHSSRYDYAKGIFRIYFKADVGKMSEFDEVMVYCYVNQFNQELTHYKEYNQSVNPVLSTDLKFFGS
ncbi:hypothetical protein TDB9533_01057 [Thalassocella blandensis]|nr:hypothetical protein TDB9533_01057 [Thalassocella blandensis]